MSEDLNPLCVDLDGTVVYGDMSLKSFISYILKNPLRIFVVGFWHLWGRSYTKYRLSKHFKFAPQDLRYIQETINFLKEEKAKGRKIYLCTGSCVKVAMKISFYLGLFDGVMGTKVRKNFIGKVKAQALVSRFGEFGFDYVGNSSQDLNVWNHSDKIYIVNASKSTMEQAKSRFDASKITILDE